MLAVGVDERDVRGLGLEKPGEAGAQRRALSGIHRESDDGGTGFAGGVPGTVGRSVVDDEDARDVAQKPSDDAANGRLGLIRRHQRDRQEFPLHAAIVTS